MRYCRWAWLAFALVGVVSCEPSTGIDGSDATSVVVTPGRDTLRALQDTARLTAEVRDGLGRAVATPRVLWTSLDTSVARVDSLGRVVSIDVGTARVTATVGAAADTAEITVLSGIPATELSVVRFSVGAAPLETRDTSIWVRRDRGVELKLRYSATGGGSGRGEEFLRFKVPGEALLRYPDGRRFRDTDSVLIRLRIDDPTRFLFHFEPSGLRFDPDRPAELEVEYQEAEDDDVQSEEDLALWRQERPDAPWVRLATVRLEDEDEVRARITGFTGFALATNRR